VTTLHSEGAAQVGGGQPRPQRPTRELAPVALVDLLDRLLGTGVVVAGDVVVSLAGVDLVEIRLHLLVTTVRAEMERDREAGRT
jgi:hypothetical protein